MFNVGCIESKIRNTLKENNINGKVKSVVEFIYNGRKTNTGFSKSELEQITEESYNSNGYITKTVEKTTFNFIKSIKTFNYDDSGKLLSEEFFNGSGRLNSKINHIYDDKARNIQKIIMDDNEKVCGTVNYQYDDNGMLTGLDVIPGKVIFASDINKVLEKNNVKYSYGKNKKVKDKVELKSGIDNSEFTYYEYDQNDNLIREYKTNLNRDTLYLVNYVFNENGVKISEDWKYINKYKNYIVTYSDFNFDNQKNIISYCKRIKHAYNTYDHLSGLVLSSDKDFLIEKAIEYY